MFPCLNTTLSAACPARTFTSFTKYRLSIQFFRAKKRIRYNSIRNWTAWRFACFHLQDVHREIYGNRHKPSRDMKRERRCRGKLPRRAKYEMRTSKLPDTLICRQNDANGKPRSLVRNLVLSGRLRSPTRLLKSHPCNFLNEWVMRRLGLRYQAILCPQAVLN